MAIFIARNSCIDAWSQVANMIVNHGSLHNVIIEIQAPCNLTTNELKNQIITKNPKAIDPNTITTRNVINTIFPYNLASHYGNRADLYNKYKQIYLNSNNKKWGTYFQRLISFDNHFKYDNYNQLEDAIVALGRNNHRKNYITLHLTARNLESNIRRIGAPCWQYGQITELDDQVSLTVIYRAQDYFHKAFGNYIGLSMLLNFICNETNKNPGKLILHINYAFNNSTRNNLQSLIGR